MDRHRVLRVLAWLFGGLLGLVALVVLAVFVVTNTDWGRERVRRFAVSTLNDLAHGEVRIGRIDGNLLKGLVAADVSITDSTGAPLVTADTIETKFDLVALIGKRIVLRDARLVRPSIVLDKKPGDDWNFERIFAGDTTATDTTTGPGWGSWFRIERLAIRDGRIVVRMPWEPDMALRGAARDSAVAVALSPESRANIVPTEGGWQTVYDFQKLTAEFPLLRIADPDEAARRFDVASMSTEAYPFRPPAAELRNLRGSFFIAEDSLWFTAPEIRFPGSQLAGTGTFRFGPGSSDFALQARPVSTADLRFAYPALPADGRGTLDVVVSIAGDTARYGVRDADLRVERATLAGDLGLVLVGDTLAFRDTDLRFADVDTRLIERLAPGVDIPRTGVLSGRAALDGALTGLDVDADLTFVDAAAGRSRVAAQGRVGVADGAVAANDLRVTIDPLQVAMVREYVPDLPVGGTIVGRATMNGSTDGELLLASLDLTHRDRGERSRVTGRAGIRRSPSLFLDIDAELRPLSLVTVGRFAPGVGLRGSATGPLRVRGALGDLAVDSRLRFNDGGRLALAGRLDLDGTIGYDVRTSMELFDASAVVATAPRTSVTARATARGVGTDPATLRTEISADLATTSVDTVAVDSATVRVRAAEGLATIDTVAVHGPSTLVAASGTFGLREGREGTLTYLVRADSLAAFAQFIGVQDTTPVAPRPGIAARAVARARADSARVAEATMVERLATGQPQVALTPVDTAPVIPSDSVAGAVYARGQAVGHIKRVDVRGVAGVEGLVARGSMVGSGRFEYAWVNGLTPEASIVAAARLDTVLVAGFALDSVDARVGYKGEQGTVDLVVNQVEDIDYRAVANFRLALDENEVRLQQLAARFGTTTWESAYPGAVRWGPRGVFVDSLDLRAGENRRIYVHGLIPNEGEADLEARISQFQVGDALALLQSDLPVLGLFTANVRMTGPATAPRLTGAVGLTDGTYDTALLPNVRATLAYADETLTSQAELLRRESSERPLAVAVGEVPINLALKTEAPRLPERPLRVDINADSLPLGLIPQFTDALADMDGRAAGAVRVRGTLRDPSFVGGLSLVQGRARIVPLGVTLRDVAARVRMAGDSVVVDSLVGYNTGKLLVRGGLGIADIAKPSFDLYLVSQGATVLNNETGRVRADAGISARGPFDALYVSGAATVTEGVIYLPEGGKNVVSTSDPALLMVADTTSEQEAELVPSASPLLTNLRADVRLAINRDTWVRSKEANVEIFTPEDPGPLQVIMEPGSALPRLRGVVATDRGEYVFQNRRFQIASGNATFVGQSEINPLLQATAIYEVQIPAQEAVQISIIIGGTLKDLQLSLESDAQPPIPQSDLISYLALGRSSSSLTQFNQGSSLTSGGATRNLVGAGAAFVTQRLTGIAVGVAVDQLEGEGARALGADVFDITPADVSIEAANPLNGVNGLLLGTQVEAGKYINRRTFVALTARPSVLVPGDGERGIPGVRVEHRVGETLRLEAVYEGRYRVRAPTLEEQQSLVSTGVFGFFVFREWGW